MTALVKESVIFQMEYALATMDMEVLTVQVS